MLPDFPLKRAMQPDPHELLRYALKACRDGKLAAADIATRCSLDLEPDNVAAVHLLGIIAARVGAREAAISYLQQALALEPGNDRIRDNLRAAQAFAPPPLPPGNRYLLIKSWGAGFWADVSQVIGSLLLAEATGRIPVTYWGADSLFSDKSERDAFTFYFEPLSSIAFEVLTQITPASFFPPRWHRDNLIRSGMEKWEGKGSRAGAVYFLNRPETIAVSDFMIGVVDVEPWLPSSHPFHGKPALEIYRHLVTRYLRPRADILAQRDRFLERHIGNRPFIALHMRGSDKAIEDPDLDRTNVLLAEALETVDPSWPILLLTDDARCLARMKTRYGARLFATECQRTSTGEGLHYLPGTDPVRAGREVLVDACLALKAQRFLGNGRSNVSAMIQVMKDWEPGNCTLICRSMLLERNLHVHQIPITA